MESGAMRVSFVVEDKIILCSEMCVNSNEWYEEELLWIYTLGYTKFEDVNGNSSMIVKWLNAHRTVWRVLYVFPREEHLKLLFW